MCKQFRKQLPILGQTRTMLFKNGLFASSYIVLINAKEEFFNILGSHHNHITQKPKRVGISVAFLGMQI